MNLFEILAVGSQSLLIIVSTIGTALITAYILSRIMNIDRDIATLVGVGSSIFAAAAPLQRQRRLLKPPIKTLPSRFP